MKIISKDDYFYLIRNGCCPEGYVEGVGVVSSQSVTLQSDKPSPPNDKALAITRDTVFMKTIQVPTIKPLVPFDCKENVQKEMTAFFKEYIAENITMPAFTQDAKEMVIKLKEEIKKKKTKLYEKIKKWETQLANNKGNRSKLERQITEANNKIREYETVEAEIKKLAVSNQTYAVVHNYSLGNNKDIEYSGSVDYNLTNGHFEIRLAKKDMATFAHELKHAYQFETGTLSGNSNWSSRYGLYDRQDEYEAFDRGRLFGSNERFGANKQGYETLPDSSGFIEAIRDLGYGMHEYTVGNKSLQTRIVTSNYIERQERLLKNPLTPIEVKSTIINELQTLATRYNIVFRVNGVTYIPR